MIVKIKNLLKLNFFLNLILYFLSFLCEFFVLYLLWPIFSNNKNYHWRNEYEYFGTWKLKQLTVEHQKRFMYVIFFNADSSTIKMWKTTHNNRGDELSSSPDQGEHGQAGER